MRNLTSPEALREKGLEMRDNIPLSEGLPVLPLKGDFFALFSFPLEQQRERMLTVT